MHAQPQPQASSRVGNQTPVLQGIQITMFLWASCPSGYEHAQHPVRLAMGIYHTPLRNGRNVLWGVAYMHLANAGNASEFTTVYS